MESFQNFVYPGQTVEQESVNWTPIFYAIPFVRVLGSSILMTGCPIVTVESELGTPVLRQRKFRRLWIGSKQMFSIEAFHISSLFISLLMVLLE